MASGKATKDDDVPVEVSQNPIRPYIGFLIFATIAGETPKFLMNGPQLQLQCYSKKEIQLMQITTAQSVCKASRTNCLPHSSNSDSLMQA